MRVPACALLVLLAAACATPESAPAPRQPVLPISSKITRESSQALANLRRAVKLPWNDNGRCVVAAAENPWHVVVERCFHALNREKVRFRDVRNDLPELIRERDLAIACGYRYTIGVLSAAHQRAIRELRPDLNVVVMDWC